MQKKPLTAFNIHSENKILRKLGKEWNFPPLIKGIHKNLTNSITLNTEKLNPFPFQIRHKTRIYALINPTHHHNVLIKQEKKKKLEKK